MTINVQDGAKVIFNKGTGETSERKYDTVDEWISAFGNENVTVQAMENKE